MLTLLLGTDWTANRAEVLKRIAGDVKQKKSGRILMVPELISHDTERRLCLAAGDTASRYAQVLSFTRLARRICDLAGSGAVECLDDGGRLVAMASAARQLHSRLKAYAAVETKPEFLMQVIEAVDEFKRCCIGPQDLKAASLRTEGSLAQKLEELSLLLESYDSLCSRGKRDPRDQMTWVLEQLEEIDFAKDHVFYVDGFPDFTRQHMAVLEHLIQNSPCVTVSLTCDVPGSRRLAFEKAGQTAKELLQIAQRANVQVQILSVSGRQDGLAPLREGLFQGPTDRIPGMEANVRLLQAKSVHQECQLAAQRVLELVRSGCRYRDISLVATDMAVYRPALQLTFDKCGIPLYMAGTEDILQSGVVATAMAALDAALGGFEQRDVLRYLRSALSVLDPDTCDVVENYAVIWGISGRGWKEPWVLHPKGLSGRWDEESRAAICRLEAARVFAMEPLMALEADFVRAKNVKEQVLALYHFWEETDFAGRIAAFADRMDAEGDNRSAQILDQLWQILMTALEQLHDMLGETVWEKDAFAKLLKLLLSQYNVGTIPTVLDAVSAGPVNAMRCQQPKHLILLGAQEGSLPGYGGSAGLLNDQERVSLRDLGLPLTGGSLEGLQAEFADIYGVFCGAEESITVSCLSQPSFIFKRLQKMAGSLGVTDPELSACIVDPRAAGAYLAKWGQEDLARDLGVLEGYYDTVFRMGYDLGSVSEEAVRSLYGNKLTISASQIEKHAQCRLSYFLQYGLRAQERKEAKVDSAEFGTYVHAVLEYTVKEVMDLGGFRQVSLETVLEIAKKHSDAYAREHYSGLESQRMQYLFQRNIRELEMVVRELWQELSQSMYTPKVCELSFGYGGQMPAIRADGQLMLAELGGKVDRVDVFMQGDASYFRVVDYKTGKKSFDYCDVFNGVGLQMLLYLFALEEKGQVIGTHRVPAGVQYFPARAPYLATDGDLTPEELAKERAKLRKRPGLLLQDEASLAAMDPDEKMETLSCKRLKDGTLGGDLADRQQMGILKDYVMHLVSDLTDEIAKGNITPNPYTRGNSFSACTYCPYGTVCHKETVEGRRDYQAMKAQEFWERIGKEEADRGR